VCEKELRHTHTQKAPSTLVPRFVRERELRHTHTQKAPSTLVPRFLVIMIDNII
jgi:hypothetical protein